MKIIPIIISLLLWATNVFAAHLEGTSHNDIVYLLSSSPNKIFRYDMSSEEWLADINLPIMDTAGAIAIDDSGLYVGYDRIIYRYDLNGQNQTHVANTSTTITDLTLVGGFLVISESGLITIIDQSTFLVTATNSSHTATYLRTGLSSANGMLRIFGRSTGVSPSDIGYMEIDNAGAIVSSGDSPYHGSYPGASKTWVFPDETRVADNAGIIYSTQSLSYLGSFSGSLDALTFVGDLPVLLRGGELIVYSNTLLESGTYTLASASIDEIFSNDSAVFVFEENVSEYTAQKILLSDFSTVEPGEPIDPTGLTYRPDAYIYDNDDNIVFLLSRVHASVFRWSIGNEEYLDSIPLLGVPEYMSVDTESNIIYLAYQSGKINKIDLNGSEFVEQQFASLPQSPLGLAQVGRFVFAVDASGAWESHYTFAPDGTLISAVDWNYPSREYIWNEVNQKIYFFRDGTSPNDLLWEDINSTTGEIGTKQDSPYHSSTGILMPIRVAPDGSVVVLGSGRVYDAISLSQINTLPNDILDAVWINGLLVTFKANTGSTNIQMWTSGYSPDGEISLSGEPLRIFSVNEELLLIRSVAGVPTFELFDLNNLPDDDADGIHNFSDNCPDIYNPDQLDDDADNIGNVCDDDADNDGLPDDYELSIGLDPSNPDDATEDLDGDTFNNITEFQKGSDPTDPSSVPPVVYNLVINFENGILPGYFNKSPLVTSSWIIDHSVGAAGSLKSMRAMPISHSQTAGIQWTDFFIAGTLEFDIRVDSESCCDYLQLYVDDVYVFTWYSDINWGHYSLDLSAGEHTIEWRYRKNSSVSSGSDTAWIDNITYLAEPLDIFGMAVGNQWGYEGGVERNITAIDQNSFPVPVYVYEIKENNIFTGTEYYETDGTQIKLWGGSDLEESEFFEMRFSQGLVAAWAPLYVGESNYSTATVISPQYPGITLNSSLNVDVVSLETVNLGFAALQAYKVNYTFAVWGYGLYESTSYNWWIVPYLGVVKVEDVDTGISAKLSSFAIGGGSISEQSDADNDGLLDIVELFLLETNMHNADTDGDGLLDGIEDLNHNGIIDTGETDPLDPDSDDDAILDGIEDANQNGIVDLSETDPNNPDSDGDGFLDGVEDANQNGMVDPGETDPCVFNSDSDQDGVPEPLDNCPNAQNSSQSDIDDDTIGDVCDNCPIDYNPYQADADSPEDGIGNACDDGDADEDGFSDRYETVCGSDPADINSRCSIGLPWLILLLGD